MWLVCRLGEIICLFTRYTTGPNILIRDVQTWTEKVKILDQLDLVEIMFSSIEKKNYEIKYSERFFMATAEFITSRRC